MEIEFNVNRPTDPAKHQPVQRQAAAAPTDNTAPFAAAQSLERSVRDLPLVRPEQVERARALVADVQYPPEETMSRIATLLALHLK